MEKTARNLILAKGLAAVAGCRFGLGIWVLYYLNFTDFSGIGLAEALMIVTAFVLEVPTGTFADVLGRKRTLSLAFLLFTLGFVLVAAAPGFKTLLAGLLVFVLGRALYSGTFQALVYDTLLRNDQTHRYPLELAKLQFFRLTALAVTCSVGGFAFDWSYRAPYVLTAAACLSGWCMTWFLTEPFPSRKGEAPRQRPLIWRTFKTISRDIWREDLLKAVLILASMLVFCEEILDDALAVAFGFEPSQLGLLFAGIYLFCAFVSRVSVGWVTRLGKERSFLLLAGVACLTLCLSPFLGLALGGLSIAIRYGARTVWDNLENEQINQMTTSANRATALSTYAMLKTLPYVLFAYPLGSLLDRVETQMVALCLGLAVLVGLVWRMFSAGLAKAG